MPSISLSVPHFEQEFPFSCVAACARMVLAYHGQVRPEAELRQLLGTGPHGTPARGLYRLGALGFGVQLNSASLAQLRDALTASVPPIVFIDTGPLAYWTTTCSHVAVVVGIDDATVALNDPFFAQAPQCAPHSEFLTAWALNAHFCGLIRTSP